MIHLNIKIGAVGDPVLFPELCPVTEVELAGMAILEHGLKSGKTSVSLLFKAPDGKNYMAQLSGGLFIAAAGAVRGAQERFGG